MVGAEAGGDSPQLSGNVLFYKQPEPLSLDRHRTLGARRIDRPFAFLRQAHVVPLTINEFALAAGHFPIIFAGQDLVPLAVMGARVGDNLFVDSEDNPDPDVYLPAFVRRYPFVFAAADNSDQMLVCIDRAAPMIGENPDVPFFSGDQPSEYTQQAIEFCREFETQRLQTEAFTKALKDLDLFEPKTVSFTPRLPDGSEGPPQLIAEYMAVSEERLNALPDDKFKMLRDTGAVGLIYAHMISLLKWPMIVQKTLRRAASMPKAAE